ncbi:MAG: CPBP family intramembrane metalloprotease [Acidobacteria bacterium]|nr:CPBP family intramembrane metalloprotease [Acidobacteriota bacterium]
MPARLTRSDWTLIAVCVAVAAGSIFIVSNWFSAAFPEAAIEFRYDRGTSRPIAERVLTAQHLDAAPMKHTATFDDDDTAKIFLERSLGLANANVVMKRDVHVWYWRHRWFRPLQEEEFHVDVAPTGEIVAFSDRIPEDRALPAVDGMRARAIAEAFLAGAGVKVGDLQLDTQSERALPRRTQRIFVWESKSIRPAGAPYRYNVTIDGDRVSEYSQRLKVPDQWQREYRELRSKNFLAGKIDAIFMGLTMVAIIVIFIIRLRQGTLPLRMLLGVGVVTFVLVTGSALNNYPLSLAGYDTNSSFAAHVTTFLFGAAMQGIGLAMALIVMVGAGEVMYRERLPNQLALPRLWARRALTSRRVFRSFILGYTLVAFFLAYQVAFYLIAERFGAWSPAEVPYDDMLKTAFPFVAVLFAGFYPAMSEELMSRAFSIPLLERLLRSRLAAVVVAAFIWGFGHSMYANQPFYIRGVEVGMAGIIIGLLFYRFGLLPLLIWHYTVDALYTALLLLRSGNRYYVASGALASLLFAVPMVLSIVLYIRNRGFLDDEALSNATMPVPPLPPLPPETAPAPLPTAPAITRARAVACVLAIAVAIGLLAMRSSSPRDAVDYRVSRAEAKRVAQQQVPHRDMHVLALPYDGFRNWEPESPREEGGSPDGFDGVAATYLVHHGLGVDGLVDAFRHKVRAPIWNVRFFTPMQKEEYFVDVDPRTAEVTGYHRYQSETVAGPRLEQPAAQAIATTAFTRFGADPRTFDLKEALSFQQPNRRDWLFHFQERRPLAAEGFRRASIRVQGAEVTQFASTIHIPEASYREASARTVINTLYVILWVAGLLTLLTLIVAGLVIATRKGDFPWQRAVRWTALLAIFPIIGTLTDLEPTLFSYSTSVQWETFLAGAIIDVLKNIGVELAAIFLAVVGIGAAVPFAPRLVTDEGRRRFGRAAVVSSLTALAIMGAAIAARDLITHQFPSLMSVDGLGIPSSVAIPLPALSAAGDAIVRALLVAAAAALMAVTLRPLRVRGWLIIAAAVFCVMLDSGATPRETPMMLLTALGAAVLAFVVGRHVLGRNYLAWPLTALLGLLLVNGAFLLRNHRFDLQANGVAELVLAAGIIVWLGSRGETEAEV